MALAKKLQEEEDAKVAGEEEESKGEPISAYVK